jgi:hypothetical protein
MYLDRFKGQQVWEPVVDDFNRDCHRIPWLEDRRLVIALTPRGHAGPDP